MLPHAYILYTPGGYVMSLTVEANRKPRGGPVLTDQECIRLFKSIISAYIGTYTVEGNDVRESVSAMKTVLNWTRTWARFHHARRYCGFLDLGVFSSFARS